MTCEVALGFLSMLFAIGTPYGLVTYSMIQHEVLRNGRK